MAFRSLDLDGNPKILSKRILAAIVIAGVIVGFVIGILIGRYATCPSEGVGMGDGLFLPGVSEALVKDGDPAIAGRLLETIKADNIRNYLNYLAEEPHIAGRQRDHDLAHYIRQFWLDAGLDDVTLTPYDVLLSYPDDKEPNVVRLLDSNGNVLYESPANEDILRPEENKTGVVPPFNAYSANGTVKGDLVYVNYGRVEDYAWLENNTNINVSGKVVIARYGKIFRGSKVSIAQRHGAIGVIIYSDPADYTAGNDTRVYPDTWWLPPSGAQRGTVYTLSQDPLTPDYPAIGTAYRYSEEEVELPKIPCHPIGYGIAEELLRAMGGQQAQIPWRGKLNVSYNLGPGFVGQGTNGSIELRINTRNQRALSYNVIGIIRGAVEPDRYVLFGNHRDAWVFGAIDPSSGTAVMMEVSRAMAQLVKSGQWRPRRSIMFCSWGAEEYGLIGSTEWTEQYSKNLQNRAVAYINIDIAVQGNYSFRALGSPLLYRAAYEATKKVPNPNNQEEAAGLKTVYDKWLASFPKAGGGLPVIGELGSGSDYAPLLQKVGISSVDLRYTYNTHEWQLGSYPLYHSVYETFYAVDKLIDQGFQCHLAIARVGAELARNLADSLILPFNVSDYASQLRVYYHSLMNTSRAQLEEHHVDTDLLSRSIDNFTLAVTDFQTRLASVNRFNPMMTRMVNDQLSLLNKAFLDPNGLPLRHDSKHIIFAENLNDAYAGSSFPGLVDLLFEIDLLPEPNRTARWEEVKRHYSVILFTIQSAASTLDDVTKFLSDHL